MEYKYCFRPFRKPNMISKPMYFQSYHTLVNFLSQGNYKKFIGNPCKSIIGNRYLEECITPSSSYTHDEHQRYLVEDANGLNIYSKQLIHDVTSHKYDSSLEPETTKFSIAMYAYLFPNPENIWKNYMSGTKGKYRNRRDYRSHRFLSLIREANNPEYQEFIRKGGFPTTGIYWWSEVPRSRAKSRSWKDTAHYRKQWERKLHNSSKSRGKGVFVMSEADWSDLVEGVYVSELDILDTIDPVYIDDRIFA